MDVDEEAIAEIMKDADPRRAAELLIAGAVAAAGAGAGEVLIGAALKFWDETYGEAESLRLAHRTLAALTAAADRSRRAN